VTDFRCPLFIQLIHYFLLKGYSWKTNQYGLTVDTVTAYELVKPNGNVVAVTESSDPALFNGLKVGYKHVYLRYF
jgi:hypothetical protein